MTDRQMTESKDTAVTMGYTIKNKIDSFFLASPGLPGYFQTNFDYQLVRVMGEQTHGGSEVGECLMTAKRIKDGDIESFTQAWANLAQRVETLANTSLAGGHTVSAREAFLRATNYYRVAFFFLKPSDPRLFALWRKSRACFQQAAALYDHPFEPVQIPYEGTSLPGYFLSPDASGRPRPTVLIQGGGDTTGEELYFWGGEAAIRRGYNALLFEGPGQRGAVYQHRELVFRPDWEVPVKAVVDFALSRPEVDAARLGIIGYSMGGYFTARAVAFEKRIRACIANSLAPDLTLFKAVLGLDLNKEYGSDVEAHIDFTDPLRQFFAEDFAWRFGVSTTAEMLEQVKAYQLWGLEDKITCPLLNVYSAGEGKKANEMSRQFYDALTCPKAFHFIEDDEGAEAHCQVNNTSLDHMIEFDWLDDVLK